MRRPFIGRSIQWLEGKLQELQEEKATGKRTTSWSAGDTSVSKTLVGDIDSSIDAILYELYCQDPEKYPLTSITRNSVTVGRFRDIY